MTEFEVYWEASGRVTILADSGEEAKRIVSNHFGTLCGPYPSHSMSTEFIKIHIENEIIS